jgi:heme-degrading monooxygenase HmoA
MWARVARYEVEPEQLDAAVEGFESAARSLAELRGMQGGFLLVDRDDGAALTVTLWESYDLMCASEVAAAGLRRQAMEHAQGTVAAVHLYEVAAEFGNGDDTGGGG